jgi:hypothetical protein
MFVLWTEKITYRFQVIVIIMFSAARTTHVDTINNNRTETPCKMDYEFSS